MSVPVKKYYLWPRNMTFSCDPYGPYAKEKLEDEVRKANKNMDSDEGEHADSFLIFEECGRVFVAKEPKITITMRGE